MRRHFSRMHQKKGSERALGVDPFFRDGLCFFFFFFLLSFYFIILILYTTDFNPTINKDIIMIMIMIMIMIIIISYSHN